MVSNRAQISSERSGPDGRSRVPVRAFAGVSVVGAGLIGISSLFLFGQHPIQPANLALGLVFYGVAMVLAGYGLARHYPHKALGLCNGVTGLRLAMVAVLVVGLVAGAGQSWALFGFACVALALDGVDGWLARRQSLTSAFGARFDMEVDAIFALVLAVMAFSNGVVGIYVLVLGLPSYLFFAAKFVWPWLDKPLPDRFSRKAVCVAQLGVLIVLQLPLDFQYLLAPLTLAVAIALLWSFGRDIKWLARA